MWRSLWVLTLPLVFLGFGVEVSAETSIGAIQGKDKVFHHLTLEVSKSSAFTNFVNSIRLAQFQSFYLPNRHSQWQVSADHGLIKWSVDSGFLSYSGYSLQDSSPAFTVPAYLALIRIHPMAGFYRWQALSVELRGALLNENLNGINSGRRFRPFTHYFGLNTELIELIKGEPRPWQLLIGGGITSARPNPIRSPDLESYIPYISTEVSYKLRRNLSTKMGLTYVPVSFGALTTADTLVFVPNASFSWTF